MLSGTNVLGRLRRYSSPGGGKIGSIAILNKI